MPRINIQEVISNSLQGEMTALVQLSNYLSKKQYTDEEIQLLEKMVLGTATKNCHAMNLRGYMHEYGIGVPVNQERAKEYYKKAIKRGSIAAMNNLAHLYRKNENPDISSAIAFYEKAIDLEDPHAMNQLACIYASGESGIKNIKNALELLERAISLNHSSAMYNLADMYRFGLGIDVNYERAISLYRKAIKRGHDGAMYERARMYECGIGGEVNKVRAVSLYEKSRHLGNEQALMRLAHCYFQDENYELSLECYSQAAKLGYVHAIYMKASFYRFGWGVAQNNNAAIKLFDMAIRHGHAEAMVQRAAMHLTGVGGPIDLRLAVELFDRARNSTQDNVELYTIDNTICAIYCSALDENKISLKDKDIFDFIWLTLTCNPCLTDQTRIRQLMTKLVQQKEYMTGELIYLSLTGPKIQQDDVIKLLLPRKRDILNYIFAIKDKDEQLKAVKQGLDNTTALGKLFHTPSTFLGSTSTTIYGTSLHQLSQLYNKLTEEELPKLPNLVDSFATFFNTRSIDLVPIYISKNELK